MAVSEVHLVWLEVPYNTTLLKIFSSREEAEKYAEDRSKRYLYPDSLARYTVTSLEVEDKATISQS